MNNNILDSLTQILKQRKGADPQTSYVASLYAQGTNKILEKVGEEATEMIIAAKDLDTRRHNGKTDVDPAMELKKEAADLWFHTMVLLTHLELSHQDILDELGRRFGVGGHEEKANR